MTKTQLTITGMTCGMCVQHVTAALESVTGVRSATVDLSSGVAVVEHDTSVEELSQAVEAEGYNVEMATTAQQPAHSDDAASGTPSCSCCAATAQTAATQGAQK